MEYKLIATHEQDQIPLTKRQHDIYLKAADSLYGAIAIEERYDAVLANYAEYEEEMLRIDLDAMIHCARVDLPRYQNYRRLVGRRLINLLAATNLYFVGTRGTLLHIYGRTGSAAQEFDEARDTHRDNHFEFRAMEQVRNQGAHVDLPVHGTRFSDQLIEQEPDGKLAFHFDGMLDPTQLLKDTRLDANFAKELTDLRQKLPLTPLVRKYTALITEIHSHVRSRLASDLEKWGATLREALMLLNDARPRETPYIGCSIAITDGDKVEGHRYFALTAVDRWSELVAKNLCNLQLDRMVAVGDALPRSQTRLNRLPLTRL